MTEDDEDGAHQVWPVFGDLMACLFGLFVLFFVWAIAFQVDLAEDLATERAALAEETARREELERALAVPLASGAITLSGGRIGIRGSVLFGLNSAELEPAGRTLIQELGAPLARYLEPRDEVIMVSGFTDDRPVLGSPHGYDDNWELSAQRALTVTRALLAAKFPPDRIFAAAFGDTRPIAANASPEGRAQNRRVEIAPIARRAAVAP